MIHLISALCSSHGTLRNILELIELADFNLRLDHCLNGDVREWLTGSDRMIKLLHLRTYVKRKKNFARRGGKFHGAVDVLLLVTSGTPHSEMSRRRNELVIVKHFFSFAKHNLQLSSK